MAKKPEYIPPYINPKRIQTEEQSRINVINIATGLGLKFDAEAIFRKYDAILAKHQNPDERKQIATMAAAEIYKLLGFQDGLQVGGTEVIPPSEAYIAALPDKKEDKVEDKSENKIIV